MVYLAYLPILVSKCCPRSSFGNVCKGFVNALTRWLHSTWDLKAGMQ